MMLKVLLWAYANGIRASRKIEDRLRSDVVCMWLSGRQTPDFRTICDFRRCNEAAIDRLLELSGTLTVLSVSVKAGRGSGFTIGRSVPIRAGMSRRQRATTVGRSQKSDGRC
jgi:hypothetical protein